jgi:hypothetical protein
MKQEERDELETMFRIWEKRSTYFVIVVFFVILLIQVINPSGTWKEVYVMYSFRIAFMTIILFVVFELLKDIFFPLIAKYYFKNKKTNQL